MLIYGLIFLNVILLVSGQVLWKLGLDRLGGLSLESWPRLLTSLPILGGLVIYAAATVVWFIVLSRTKLSLAYPLQSIAYILGMLAGLLVFKETVPPLSWLGVILILGGVTLISLK